MPNPFPGMNPWLDCESIAGDLQLTLCVLLCDALNVALPEKYVARLTSHEWWEEERRRPVSPDVIIHAVKRSPGDPLVVPVRERYIQRRDSGVEVIHVSQEGQEKCAVIEVVSRNVRTPSHPARTLFEQGQREDLAEYTNRVEIDLFRFGRSVSPVSPHLIDPCDGPDGPRVCVFRHVRPAEVLILPVHAAHPLPTVPIPFDDHGNTVEVSLQPLLDRAYVGGRYGEWIDYRRPPDPPLTPEQQAWADGILKAKGVIPTA